MKKKSAGVSLANFSSEIVRVRAFIDEATRHEHLNDFVAHCYDLAVLWAYRGFEAFVLDILIAQINRNPDHLYGSVGVNFGKNPTAAQCEYLLVGDRYFDFRGHGGLVDVVRKAAGSAGQLVTVVRMPRHRQSFEILLGLRNYSAHRSDQSKEAALKAMRLWEPTRNNLGNAGFWLGRVVGGRTRMERLLTDLEAFAADMKNAVN